MRSMIRLPMLLGGALVVAGFAAGCDDGPATEPERAADASVAANAALEPNGPVAHRGFAGVHPGVNDPGKVSVPADMLARVRSHLPDGFEIPAAPRRPEPMNLWMGEDPRAVDRAEAPRPAESGGSHVEWQATLTGGDEAGTESSLPPIGAEVICPPDQEPTGNCDPAPLPPPPDSDPDPEPEPEPDPITIIGVSFVQPRGFGFDGHSYEYVDFGSYTQSSEPLDVLNVTGFSFIDGLPEQVISHSGNDTAFVGVGWTYWAAFFGYGFLYEQEGEHGGCVSVIGGGSNCTPPGGGSYDFMFDF